MPELSSINATGRRTLLDAAPADGEVLGRLNGLGKAGLVATLIGLAVAYAFLAEWIVDNGPLVALIPIVFGLIFLRPVFLALFAGGYSLLRRGGRAIWIDDDRLKAIDWWNGLASIRLDRFTHVRFEPAYKHNKTTEPVLLLQRPNRKPYVIGVRHIDTPGAELAARIESLRAAKVGR
jgi:hypothetical protein